MKSRDGILQEMRWLRQSVEYLERERSYARSRGNSIYEEVIRKEIHKDYDKLRKLEEELVRMLLNWKEYEGN